VDFNISFASPTEESSRESIFWNNMRKILSHNFNFRRGRTSFKLGINQFAHMTFDEISRNFSPSPAERARQTKSAQGTRFIPKTVYSDNSMNLRHLPESFDWRDRGVVTKVKNQFLCGACYAMATLAALESHHLLATGENVSLSVQEIVDCAGDYQTFGCRGGMDFRTIDFVKDRRGISSEAVYPFTGQVGRCRAAEFEKVAIDVKGYGMIPKGKDPTYLKKALIKLGPILVPVDSDLETFKRYSSGIFFDENCKVSQLNHLVLLVGYGHENGEEFWIVKNSYGEFWGEKGFMRIAMNRSNDCGVTKEPIYPIIVERKQVNSTFRPNIFAD
jgi:cathepsin L